MAGSVKGDSDWPAPRVLRNVMPSCDAKVLKAKINASSKVFPIIWLLLLLCMKNRSKYVLPAIVLSACSVRQDHSIAFERLGSGLMALGALILIGLLKVSPVTISCMFQANAAYVPPMPMTRASSVPPRSITTERRVHSKTVKPYRSFRPNQVHLRYNEMTLFFHTVNIVKIRVFDRHINGTGPFSW